MAKPGSPMAGQLSYALSVHIPGDSAPVVLAAVNVGTVFGAIKDQVWAKKGWENDKTKVKKNFTFRVVGGEMYFGDDDMLSSLVHVSGMFRDSPDRNAAPEVALYPTADIADKQKRETLLCSQSPVLWNGYLNKLGEGMLAGWTKRYFVLQDNTLFYFADEKAWQSGGKEKAKGFVPMPCHFVRHNEHKGQKLVFELQAKHLGKRNYFMSADNEQAFEGWRRVCNLMSLRRAKTVTATVCEELTTRGVSELEMLFQLPGNKDVVTKLRSAFDNGDLVRLGDVTDFKAMADVVKAALRDTLQEPVLTYALYPRWIAVPTNDDAARIAEVRSLLSHLPTPTQSFLEFFMGFLWKVASASLTNMMTPKLLALCVGPLMMQSDDKAKQTDDYRAIETMIECWPQVFRTAEDERKALKPLDAAPAPPPPPAAAASTSAASGSGDGVVNAADAAAWRQRFQYANGNWEKDWRLRQKHVMNGLGELHTKLKSTGTALPAGLGDMNACFLAEAEWRAESLTAYDDLIAKLSKLTAQVQAMGPAPPPPPSS